MTSASAFASHLDWSRANDRYLSAEINWINARLAFLAHEYEQHQPDASQPAPAAGSSGRGLRWLRPRPETASEARLVKVNSKDFDRLMKEATDQLEVATEAVHGESGVDSLVERLSLRKTDRNVLLMCIAAEHDPHFAHLASRVPPYRPQPTHALGTQVYGDLPWNVLAAEGRLRAFRLIEVNQPSGQALLSSALRIDERILGFVFGIGEIDDRLRAVLNPVNLELPGTDDDPLARLPRSQQQVVQTMIESLRLSITQADGLWPAIRLTGSDPLNRQLLAGWVAVAFGHRLYLLSSDWLPGSAAELDTFVRLWERETLLNPVALYIEANVSPGDSKTALMERIIEQCSGMVFLDSPAQWPTLNRPLLTIETLKPTPQEQQAAWCQALPALGEGTAARLANAFNLNLTTIQQIARVSVVTDSARLFDRTWGACLVHTQQQLDALAQRIDARAGWNDLVLPDEEKELLRQVVAQVELRNQVYAQWAFDARTSRGLGLNALFAGESGTGKTLAAEVIAQELRLNLYRIDLSAVISKYIGETEKNLRMLFDAAESGGVILFFDEADALFGKRSEVKDSHDRYANIEINYLLQRMEAFRGLAILATNMKSALDNAFMRRLRFVINFPFPGREQRRDLWSQAFPVRDGQVPPTLDYDWLARLPLTGGNIHTIALNAAFLAAQRGQPVDMPVVLKAARSEMKKLDKPVNEADFRWSGS